LIMELPYIYSIVFALVFYGAPIGWNTMKGNAKKRAEVSQQ
jgi:ABC-type polysaccharide/polyol phosphate export permease